MVLDGAVLPIGRIAADRPYCSGKKKHHGMNVQVLADPAGRLIRASDALPGATHDLTTARAPRHSRRPGRRRHQVLGRQGISGRRPCDPRPDPGKHLRGRRRRHNRDHAKIRSHGERAMAILKPWRLLRKLRCGTTRITAVVRAVVALALAIRSR
ncbi:transposase family protein [Streptomyces sp. rh34]|uniref:transposase family protein n=1 Tax=Streptomyces sp. rh34 TaxID=2034272 RepID=UPI0015CF4C14|nr:transposase family protein [Streptomyces sp. rh34]